MKVAIVLSLTLALAAGSPVIKVERPANTGRIVGGVEATPHEFPWMVDMRRPSHYCGATIISPEWVVTAAHCTTGAPSSYTLVAGDHNIQSSEGREQTRQVVAIINHPNYNGNTIENDIALMKVDPPFEFNQWVSAVQLPESTFAPTPNATVAGWGALTEGGSSPAVLMKVTVPHVDDDTCNAAYGGDVYPSMVCYGEGGKDSCQGDSGGPIMCGENNTLCGIVSWGYGCARPGYPGVYTETSWYHDWIRSMTEPAEEDDSPVTTVTECGGQVDASSGRIQFRLGQLIQRGTKCMWTVKTPYDRTRWHLVDSGLTVLDTLHLTRYNTIAGEPGNSTQITQTNVDYNIAGGMVLVTLDILSQQARGINLEFYSSGFGDASPSLTGHAVLNTTSGSFSYPVGGGNYRNLESALFLLSPSSAGDRRLTFSRLDVEADTSCRYDAVSVYSWQNKTFNLESRFCGSSRPPPFIFPGGIGMVTFTTDDSVTGTGFTFDWE